MPKSVEQLETSEIEPSPERAPAPEAGRTSRVKFAVLIFFLAVAGTATWAYRSYRYQVSTDDAQVDGHVSGVAPKVSGNIVEVLVNDNQPVRAGQVLVRIDARDYEARVAQAKAVLEQAESQLNSARVVVPWTNETTQSGAGVASAQLANAQAELERARAQFEQASASELAFAEANVRARQANNERAQADLARMKPLVEKAEISRQQFDAYVAAASVTDSELDGARQKLASAQKETSIRKASLEAAQSRVEQARAQVANSIANRKQVQIRTADAGTASAATAVARAALDSAELQLGYCTITAPIDGVVTRKSVEVGNIVQPGQGLMAIIPLHDTWVTANFKETQLADVRVGQRAEIHVDMYGKTVTGRVDSIAGATGARMSLLPPENATGNFVKVVQRIPVKILVDRHDDLVMRPGMNVGATIYTK
jgi:membrane fusion protein, multidrug efflux system